jgi:hypothetical protein
MLYALACAVILNALGLVHAQTKAVILFRNKITTYIEDDFITISGSYNTSNHLLHTSAIENDGDQWFPPLREFSHSPLLCVVCLVVLFQFQQQTHYAHSVNPPNCKALSCAAQGYKQQRPYFNR